MVGIAICRTCSITLVISFAFALNMSKQLLLCKACLSHCTWHPNVHLYIRTWSECLKFYWYMVSNLFHNIYVFTCICPKNAEMWFQYSKHACRTDGQCTSIEQNVIRLSKTLSMLSNLSSSFTQYAQIGCQYPVLVCRKNSVLRIYRSEYVNIEKLISYF